MSNFVFGGYHRLIGKYRIARRRGICYRGRMQKARLAVLGSGSGSNCQSLFDAIDRGELNAEVVTVLSDNPDAYILQRAVQRGIPVRVLDCAGYKNKFPEEKQQKLAEELKELKIDLVCLAGFMRLVKKPLLDAFPRRILNIHPSLLPLFPGIEAWKQALEAGASESGCTVHYVDAGMDTGDIVLQAKVPVEEGDTPESLHARIQVQEHIIYPAAVRIVLSQETH